MKSKLFPFLFILVVLTGCAHQNSTKLEVWTITLRPKFTQYMENVIHHWEENHPNTHIDWIDLPISAIQQKLIASLISGKSPSVVNLNTDMMLQLSQMGVLSNLENKVPQEIKARYLPGLWQSFSIPWYVSTQVLLINRQIFTQAGLNPDLPPKTKEALIQDAVIIKKKTGVYGWLPSIKFLDELQEEGIPILSQDKKQALFDSKEAVDYLQTYITLFKQGFLPRETLELSRAYQDAVDLYQGGKLGILQAGPQFLNRVHDNAPSIYNVTEVAPLPMGKARLISAACMNLVIPKNGPLQEEALDFALYLTNDQNQLNFSKEVLVFPSTKKAAADPFFHEIDGDPLMAKSRDIVSKELPYAQDLTLGLNNAKARNEALKEALETALLQKKNCYDALHEAALLWDKLLQ